MTSKAVKESQTATTGGRKFDGGKLQYGLLPPLALKATVEILTFGAEKYEPDNWKHVPDSKRRYFDAMQRQAVQAIKKTPGGVGDYDYLVQTMNDLTQPMENMAKLFGEGKFDEGAQQMTNLFNTLGKVETDFTNNIQNIVNKLVGADAQLRTTIYGTPVTTPNTTS